MIITIDGPSGSGKSTVARLLAQELGFYYLNTGLLYRALAYLVFHDQAGVLVGRPAVEVYRLQATQLPQLERLRYSYEGGAAHLFVDGREITGQLYSLPDIAQEASALSALPAVRQLLLQYQRDLARQHDVIADGRDCGSVVFPAADFKFFLTASVDARAQRRLHDEKGGAGSLSLDGLRHEIAERDARDEQRAAAPLVVPAGAVEIDSSGLTIDQVKEMMLARIRA